MDLDIIGWIHGCWPTSRKATRGIPPQRRQKCASQMWLGQIWRNRPIQTCEKWKNSSGVMTFFASFHRNTCCVNKKVHKFAMPI